MDNVIEVRECGILPPKPKGAERDWRQYFEFMTSEELAEYWSGVSDDVDFEDE